MISNNPASEGFYSFLRSESATVRPGETKRNWAYSHFAEKRHISPAGTVCYAKGMIHNAADALTGGKRFQSCSM